MISRFQLFVAAKIKASLKYSAIGDGGGNDNHHSNPPHSNFHTHGRRHIASIRVERLNFSSISYHLSTGKEMQEVSHESRNATKGTDLDGL